MEGFVRKKGNKWYYTIELPAEDGKRKRIERSGGKTKKEAQTALTEALYKFENGYIEPKKITCDEFFSEWLENFIKDNRKPNTYDRYKGFYARDIKPYIGNLLLKDLKPLNIERLLQKAKKRKLSNTTLQSIYGVINSALNRAVKLQIINNNICKFVERPKRDKFKANILTLEEVKKIIAELNPNEFGDYLMSIALQIELELGLRRGELAGLEWSNIDFDNNLINIENNLVYTNTKVIMGTPKTEESARTLYISSNLKHVLKKHHTLQKELKLEYGDYHQENIFNSKKYDLVMAWENGKFVHPNYYTLKFHKLIKKAGINKSVRFHDLRHTNATLLLSQGVDFKVIQTRLGHADINTTLNIYSHVSEDMQKKATDKLVNLFVENGTAEEWRKK